MTGLFHVTSWQIFQTTFVKHPEGKDFLTETGLLYIQSCPILTTCSGRESQDSTRTSRTSKW